MQILMKFRINIPFHCRNHFEKLSRKIYGNLHSFENVHKLSDNFWFSDANFNKNWLSTHFLSDPPGPLSFYTSMESNIIFLQQFLSVSRGDIPPTHGRSQNFGSGGTLLAVGLVGGPGAEPPPPDAGEFSKSFLRKLLKMHSFSIFFKKI